MDISTIDINLASGKIDDNIKACNAVIDEDFCINCNLCEKVCPMNNPLAKKAPIEWKQGWAMDSSVRERSSSGGAAFAIEKAFVEAGGVACSCAFSNGVFRFEFAHSPAEVEKFVGSKYVKSDPQNVYAAAKKILKEGKKLLFVGLPCQCAAIKRFVNEDDNLYTIDLICHGTPSQKILDMYLKETGYDISQIKRVDFRKKANFNLYIDGKRLTPETVRDKYTFSFLESLCYTENCYSCQFASIDRVSDLTLGDSWGSELDANEQAKGISLFLCQTEKGKELVDLAKLYLTDVDLDRAIKNNRQLKAPSNKSSKHGIFYSELSKSKKFNKAIKKGFPKFCARQAIKSFLIKTKILKVQKEDK